MRDPHPVPHGVAVDDAARPNVEGRFVVELLDPRRQHLELCLEIDGTVIGWSIARGPSVDPSERRLAVRMDDRAAGKPRPLTPTFGAMQGHGTTWDEGTWRIEGSRDASAALAAGQFSFHLEGGRLRGGWSLTRLKADGRRESWVLVKERDTFSTVSGSQLSGVDAVPEKEEPLGFIPPMLCTSVTELEDDPGLLYEMKYDGYRMLLIKSGDQVKLFARNGADWSKRFPSIVAAARGLGANRVVLDGEVVAFGERGIPDFGALSDCLANGQDEPLAFIAFDILQTSGVDVRRRPLVARKALLGKALETLDPNGRIRVAPYVIGEGQRLLVRIAAAGGEGVVAKQADSIYRSGRSLAWRKLGIASQADVVIVGYMPSRRSRKFASLLIASRDGNGLVFRGRVARGFTTSADAELTERLAALAGDAEMPALAGLDKTPPGISWVRPELVASVRFKSIAPNGTYVAARFVALRIDT